MLIWKTVSYLAAKKQSLTENQHSYSSCKSRWAQPQFVSNEPSKKSVFTLVSRAFPIFPTPAFPRDGLTPVLLAALVLGIWFSRFSYHVFIFLSVIEEEQDRRYPINSVVSLFQTPRICVSAQFESSGTSVICWMKRASPPSGRSAHLSASLSMATRFNNLWVAMMMVKNLSNQRKTNR